MQLSRKSWHYRLASLITDDIPDNLCGYFWKLVMVFLVIAVLMAAACCVGTLAYYITIYPIIKSGWKGVLLDAILVAVVALWTVIAVLVRRARSSQPSLVMEWIRAKKKGFCPTIEWQD